MIAEASKWFNHPTLRSRTFTETHARDSFENVLFSLCRYKEIQGYYPERITIIGFTFKQSRFLNLHCPALGYVGGRCVYHGVDPESYTREDRERVKHLEYENAYHLFEVRHTYTHNTCIL